MGGRVSFNCKFQLQVLVSVSFHGPEQREARRRQRDGDRTMPNARPDPSQIRVPYLSSRTSYRRHEGGRGTGTEGSLKPYQGFQPNFYGFYARAAEGRGQKAGKGGEGARKEGGGGGGATKRYGRERRAKESSPWEGTKSLGHPIRHGARLGDSGRLACRRARASLSESLPAPAACRRKSVRAAADGLSPPPPRKKAPLLPPLLPPPIATTLPRPPFLASMIPTPPR